MPLNGQSEVWLTWHPLAPPHGGRCGHMAAGVACGAVLDDRPCAAHRCHAHARPVDQLTLVPRRSYHFIDQLVLVPRRSFHSLPSFPDEAHPLIAPLVALGTGWNYILTLATFVTTFFVGHSHTFWRKSYHLARVVHRQS